MPFLIGNQKPDSITKNPIKHGPERPQETRPTGYRAFTNKKYLEGHAAKILDDLILMAELYNGHQIALYFVDKSKRCPKCTNLATGEKLSSNCPVCHGTGYAENWTKAGLFWCYVDFGPAYHMDSPLGNTENPNGTKQRLVILGAPPISDQSLAIFVESREVFKVYDIEPHIVAMRGDVIAQIAEMTRVTPGAPEYKLIDW